MIDKELADKIDNQDETAKLAAKLDNKSIVRLASFHSRKPNRLAQALILSPFRAARLRS